jgi:hypothetical protein
VVPVLHLGGLHPVEQALVLLLAFGPFVVLGLIVRHQRRRALHEDDPPRPERKAPGAGQP